MMRYQGRIAVVTGAGQGIGEAIATTLAAKGVRVAVVDLDLDRANRVADKIGGIALACDVRSGSSIVAMLTEVEDRLGPIDILVSNAGFARPETDGATSQDDDHWQASWDVHVMAHLRAARHLLPAMRNRREGWLINVASAAGLLSQIGDAAYSATKHAAVSLAQSLAVAHKDEGIRASVVCPLYVATPLIGYTTDDSPRPDRVISAQDVADALIDGLDNDRFLILPHPEAAVFAQRRMADTDRWIDGMARVSNRLKEEGALGSLSDLHRKILG